MAFSESDFTGDIRQTEINGRKYSTYEFNVIGGGGFEFQCKRLFLDNLEAAADIDVAQLLGAIQGKEQTDAAATVGLFQSLSKFVKDTDFKEFYAFHIECIESCYDVTDTSAVKPVSANDLKRPYNYALFFWFLRCQLGPFIDLFPPKLKTTMQAMMVALQDEEPKSSDE